MPLDAPLEAANWPSRWGQQCLRGEWTRHSLILIIMISAFLANRRPPTLGWSVRRMAWPRLHSGGASLSQVCGWQGGDRMQSVEKDPPATAPGSSGGQEGASCDQLCCAMENGKWKLSSLGKSAKRLRNFAFIFVFIFIFIFIFFQNKNEQKSETKKAPPACRLFYGAGQARAARNKRRKLYAES